MSTSKGKDYRAFSPSTPPVHIRDCLNLSFISKYTLLPPEESRTSRISCIRHYIILLDVAILFGITTISSWSLLFANNLTHLPLFWGTVGPVLNTLTLWFMAWALMVLRDVQGARDMCRIKIIGMEGGSGGFTLSMGRKYFDYIILFNFCTNLPFAYLYLRAGPHALIAKDWAGFQLLGVMMVGCSAVSAWDKPRTIAEN